MSSRTLLNLGLAALAAILALVVVYRPGLETESLPQPIITGLAAEDVVSITVTREPHARLTFTREATGWRLFTGKYNLPAAEYQVSALLRLLDTTAGPGYDARDLALAQLGLDPPQATLTFNDREIRIGGTGALDERRYVQVDNEVFLLPDQFQHLVNAEPASFVARRLLAGRGAIERLELPDLTLARAANGHWQPEPADDRATADALQQLIDNWQNASALYVSTYDGGTTDEQVTIHTTGQEEPLVLQVVSHAPDLVLARADWGVQYHLSSSLEGSLFALPEPEEAEPAPDTGDMDEPEDLASPEIPEDTEDMDNAAEDTEPVTP